MKLKNILDREKLNIFGYLSPLYKLGEIFNFIFKAVAEIIKPEPLVPPKYPFKNFEDLLWLFGGIPGPRRIAMLTLKEAICIFKTIRENKPKALLEVGIFKGGTTVIISTAKPAESKFFALDIANSHNEDIKKLLDENTFLIEGDSKTFIPSFNFDFIFIDGDHSFEGVKADFEHFFPYLNDGADILFHDAIGLKYIFASPGINSFVKTLEKNPNLKFIKDVDSLRHFKKI